MLDAELQKRPWPSSRGSIIPYYLPGTRTSIHEHPATDVDDSEPTLSQLYRYSQNPRDRPDCFFTAQTLTLRYYSLSKSNPKKIPHHASHNVIILTLI
jgi:hypothetical protein